MNWNFKKFFSEVDFQKKKINKLWDFKKYFINVDIQRKNKLWDFKKRFSNVAFWG